MSLWHIKKWIQDFETRDPFKSFKKQVKVVLACFILHYCVKRHFDDEEAKWDSSEEEDNELAEEPHVSQGGELDEEQHDADQRFRDVISLNMWMRYIPQV